MEEPTKLCPSCERVLPLSAYWKKAPGPKSNKLGVRARCKDCEKRDQKAWRSTPDGYVAAKASSDNWKNNNLDKVREYHRASGTRARAKYGKGNMHMKDRYGITPEQYQKMLVSQGGKCDICETTEPGGRGKMVIDHDHVTNEVRALLCNNCNSALGMLKDNPAVAYAAGDYLTKHHAKREKAS